MLRRIAIPLVIAASLAHGGCVTTHHVERPYTAETWRQLEAAGPISVLDAGAPRPVVRLDAPDHQLRGLWVGDPKRPSYVELGVGRGVEIVHRARGAHDGLLVGVLAGSRAAWSGRSSAR